MRKLRIDTYSGFAGDKTHTEKDKWVQCAGESDEEFIEKVCDRLRENVTQFRGDEGEDYDEDTDE